jgi:hypothetical protein
LPPGPTSLPRHRVNLGDGPNINSLWFNIRLDRCKIRIYLIQRGRSLQVEHEAETKPKRQTWRRRGSRRQICQIETRTVRSGTEMRTHGKTWTT